MMDNPAIPMKSKFRIGLSWLLLLLGLQIVALSGQYLSLANSVHEAMDKVERRVSLDSAFLDVGNTTLNTPVNQYAVARYLNRINETLGQQDYPVRVSKIQGINAEQGIAPRFNNSTTTVFDNAEQRIEVEIRAASIESGLSFSWVAFITALVIAPLFMLTSKPRKRTQVVDIEKPAAPMPTLIINLEQKTISNGVDDKAITLQNKPLCFYTALVRFCIENPTIPLSPHKDVPYELVALANKSFARLIELGHTKRKRPDFNANLDKTLSEIRAALDEVFASFPGEKEIYCPPRAQGEGSRSKQHSYALARIKQEDVQIIGN
jgi:hypothetical protein